MRKFFGYFKSVFFQWENPFGLLLWPLMILLALGILSKTAIWVWGGFLFVTLFLAGYQTYKNMLDSVLTTTRLSVEPQSVCFGPLNWYQGMPNNPLLFDIRLDIINRSQQDAILYAPESVVITKFTLNTNLLADRPCRLVLYKFDGRGLKQKSYPCTIRGNDREALVYEIGVQLLITDPLEFSRRLNELKNYEFEIQFCLNKGATQCYETVLIQDSFDEFKKDVLSLWGDNSQFHGLHVEHTKTTYIN